MNDITIILWITIALIGIIAIILVKLHFKGDELEQDEGSILPSSESINNVLNAGKNIINLNKQKPSEDRQSLSPQTSQQNINTHNLFKRTIEPSNQNDEYVEPKIEINNLENYEYASQNQILINYDNNVEKFQEPIKQNQIDIMTQNNKDTTELKDLFTIDELIKESKRKDSEREKESQKIKKIEEDNELNEIKESIKNKTEEPLIEEIINEETEEKISDLIKENETDDTVSLASQKDIDEAINTASKENKEETESITEDKNITNVLLNQQSEQNSKEIAEPSLKTPSKVSKNNDYEFGASIDDVNLFEENEEDSMDLDYRKDLDKFANKIKGSKIFQEVKEKLSPENDEDLPEITEPEETYIRNVNDYDEYEPIINETHLDYEASYEEYHDLDYDQRLRQENTRKVFNMAKNSLEPEIAKPKIDSIKSKPSRDNIKINLNNNEVVLKKGDEIIYNHLGETYSSQVYAINGDDISVRYRRKDITIKPSDVKKIY